MDENKKNRKKNFLILENKKNHKIINKILEKKCKITNKMLK